MFDHPPPLGILMLDTNFPRIVGDGGNPASYPYPTIVRRVAGADVDRAVRGDPRSLLDLFVSEGRGLVEDGCCAIITTCGFLAPLQDVLSAALPVPIATSALLECARVQRRLSEGRVAVLTIAASALTRDHLDAARVPDETPIGTLEGGTFARSILGNAPTLDVEAARAEHVAAARMLVAEHPATRAIVLECANMPPYADDIAAATGLPVHSVLTMAHRLRDGAIRSLGVAH